MFFESLEERAMLAFTPGSAFRFGGGAGEAYLHNLPLEGGTLGSPFATFAGEAHGQLAWSGDVSTAYSTNYLGGVAGEGAVLAIGSSGNVTTFATGLNGPTGILRTQDGRLLVAESATGSIVDITAGGDASALPRFATGLSSPGNLVQRASGEILVLEVGSGELTALGSGGDLSVAIPLATFGGASQLMDIVESTAGGLLVSDSAGRAIYQVTVGGSQSTTATFATGRAFGGLTFDATGRLLAGGVGADGGDVFDASAGGDLSTAAPLVYQLPSGTAALDVVPEPVETSTSLTPGGDLVLEFAGAANNVSLSVSGDQLVLHDPGVVFAEGLGTRSVDGHTLSIPLASITGALVINGGEGDDTLTIDLNGGDPIPAGGLIYHGGGQSTDKPGDSLVIRGGLQGAVTYNYTNANDGSIEMSNFGTITYTGLEPIENYVVDAQTLVFNLPDTEDQISLSASGSNLVLDSLNGTFEDTTFGIAGVTSITINTAGGADTFTLSGVTAGFAPALTVDMGTGADAFAVGAATSLGGTFTLTTETVTQTAPLTVTGLTQILAEAAGTTNIALTDAANNFSSIAIGHGSTVAITDGDALVVAGANVDTLLTLNAAGAITQTAALSGAGGLTKAGAGTLTLSQANTYGGVTTVSAGTLRMGADNRLPATTDVVLTGGNFDVNSTNQALRSLTFSGGGIFGATAAGKTLSLSSTGDALIFNSAGGRSVNVTLTGATGGNVVVTATAGGAASHGGVIDLGSQMRVFNIDNPNTGGSDLFSTGNITGSGGVIKTGPGTLKYEAENTYTGLTDIQQGELVIQSQPAISRIPDANAVQVSGGVFQISGHTETIGSLKLLSGELRDATGGQVNAGAFELHSGTVSLKLGGTGNLLKTSTGTVTISGVNSYAGTTTIDAGTLTFTGGDNRVPATTDVVLNAGTLNLGGANQAFSSLTVNGGTLSGANGGGKKISLSSTADAFVVRASGGRAINLALTGATGGNIVLGGYTGASMNGSGIWDLGGVDRVFQIADVAGGSDLFMDGTLTNGGIIKTGLGTLKFNVAGQTFSKLLEVREGAAFSQLTNALADTLPIVVNGGTFTHDQPDTVGSLTLISGSVTGATTGLLSASAFELQSGTITLKLGGSGNLTKSTACSISLAGPHSYTGTTTIDGGTLTLTAAGALAAGGGLVTVNAGGTLVLNNGGAMQRSGNIAAGGTLHATTGAGALTGAGTITTTAGSIVRLSAATSLSGSQLQPANIAAGTIVELDANEIVGINTVSGGATFVVRGADRTQSAGINLNGGVLTNDGASRQLTGTITVGASGATVAASTGTNLTLNNSNVSGAAKLTINSATPIHAVNKAGNVAYAGSGTFGLNTASMEIVAGSFTHNGGGATFVLGGGTGELLVNAGTTFTSFTGALINAAMTLNGTARFTVSSSPSVGSLAGSGNLILGSPSTNPAGNVPFATGSNGLSTVFSGVISQDLAAGFVGSVTKVGAGTLTLGGANTYQGPTTITGGRLNVNGSLAATSTVTVHTNGTLGGTGTVGGSIAVNGGTIAPGTSPGVLDSGSVSFSSTSVFAAEIDGASAGDGNGFHVQLNVTGTVALGNGTTTLSVSGAYVPATGDDFVLIVNDGSDSTTGFFAGLPEGTQVNFSGRPLYITYRGGDGNDVVLTTSLAYSGSAGADAFVLTGDGTNFTLTVNGGAPLQYTNLTDITINGGGGDDSLTVDFSAGGAIPVGGIVFNGNGQDGSGAPAGIGDWLRVVGTGTQATTYLPNGSVNASLDNDGVLTVDGRSITFTGLEPMDVENVASAAVNLPGAADLVTVEGGLTFGSAQPAIRVSGSSGGVTFETVAYRNVGTVTINTVTSGSDGDDTITLNAIAAGHGNGNLTINTGSGADTVNINGVANFDAANVALSFTSGGNIAFGSGGELITPAGTGSVTLTAGGQISDADAENDVTAGSLSLSAAGTSPAISLDFRVSQLTTNSATGNGTQDLNQVAGTASILSLNAGTGVVTLSGAFATSAANVVNDATGLVVNNSLTLGGSETIGSLAGVGSVALGANTLTTGGSNASTTFSGGINGSGGLAKAGSGDFTLSGSNTYSGATTINAGTLSLSGSAAIADVGIVNLPVAGASLVLLADETIGGLSGIAGTTVNLNANKLTAGGANSPTTYAGAISGVGGSLEKTGTASFTLSGSAPNTYTGLTTIGGTGIVVFAKTANVDAVGGNVDVTTGTLRWDQPNQLPNASSITQSGGSVAFNGRSETFTNYTKTGGSTQTGGGSAVISITGTLSVSSGSPFDINSPSTVIANTMVFTGGAMTIGGGGAVLEIGTGGLTMGNGTTINLNEGSPGAILRLNGNVTASGTATINGVVPTGSNVLGRIDLNGGNRTFSTSGTLNVSANISNGSLTKAGGGSMRVSRANTYSGTTSINDGIFELVNGGTISNTSAITVGAAGTPASLQLNNNATYSLLTGNLTLVNSSSAGGLLHNVGDVTINGAIVDGGTASVFSNNGVLTITSGLAADTLSVANTNVGPAENATVRVAGGAVTLGNGASSGDLVIGGRVTATTTVNTATVGLLDLSSATSVNISFANIYLGRNTAGDAGAGLDFGDNSRGTLLLSLTGPNTVTTSGDIIIGDSDVAPSNTDLPPVGNGPEDWSRFVLGNGANNINTNALRVGRQRSNGEMRFAGTGGTLTLRGATGGTSTANLVIGANDSNSTSTIANGVLDLTGGTFNALLGIVVIGRHGGGSGGGHGTLTYEAGSATVSTSLTLAVPNNGGNTSAEQNVSGTINLNGTSQLIVNVATFTNGDNIAGEGDAAAIVNVNGGTLRFRNLSRQAGGTFNVNFASGTIGNVTGQSLTDSNVAINLQAPGVHNFDVEAGQTATFQVNAPLTSAGSLTKIGGGNLVLQATNTYSGSTNVNAGVLTLQHASNNNIAASPSVTVAAGATLNVMGLSGGRFDVVSGQTLRGEGVVIGAVQVNAGGQIAPGMSPGILNTGSLSFVGGSFAVEIEGDAAGSGAGLHDQLNVTGTVALGAGLATLMVTGSFVANLPTGALQDFVIINNDGTDDTTGYFVGLQEGSAVTLNGRTLYITYNGGDGNDVVLNTQPILSGTSLSDTLEITPLAGGNLQYTFTAGPLAGTSGTIIAPQNFHFGGNAGDDVLIVNVNGNPLPAGGITLDGEAQSGTNPPTPAGGDALKLVGSGQDAVYQPDLLVTGQGVIVVSGPGGGTIGFAGLEPVDMSGFGNVTVELLGANDLVTIAEGFDSVTGLIPALVLSGSSGGVAIEALHAWNNASVIVDTTVSDGNDTVTVTGAANAHGNANLVIETGVGTDSVTFSGAATFTGDVTVDSQAIAVNSLITATSVDLDANSGAITTLGTVVDVAATTLTAVAATGIDLDTQIVDLSASVTGAGNLQIDEVDGLNLTALSVANGTATLVAGGALSDSAGTAATVSGNATLTAAGIVLGDNAADSTNFGTLTFVSSAAVSISEDSSLDLIGASSSSGTGGVTLASTDGSFSLPTGASLSVSGAGADITLNVADDVVIEGSVTAVDQLAIHLDGGVADVGGSTLTIAASSVITTGGGVTGGTVITGGAESDTFSFCPQATTAFVVDGGAPVSPVFPGDTLSVDLSDIAAGNTVLTLGATAGSGSYSFTGGETERSVSFTSIENNATVAGDVHLVLDLALSGFEDGAADAIDARLDAGGATLQLRVNSATSFYSGPATSIRSLTVIGSDDADTFALTEVNGQLPSFVAAAPAVDNTSIGGGVSLGAHQNATATSVLGAQPVTIHFVGGAGSNMLGLVLTSTDDATYFADTVGSDQSGNLSVPADTLLSFVGVAGLDLTGAGGSLSVDASSTPAVSTITLDSPAAGETSVGGNVDLATSLASGFAGLSVLGGDGAETIEVLAVGAGLTTLTLSGNNRSGTDAAADTLRVHTLPAGITSASLIGGAGSDTFQLYSSTSTVDGIQSPVTINGSDGNVGGNTDTLVVIDSGDGDGDTVAITQNSIEGLTGYSGTPDVSFTNIDVLTVTTTAGADTITTTLAAGSDLNTVTVSGNDLADQFYLSLPDPGAGPGSGIATVNLNGDAGNDSFGDAATKIQPSRTTAVNINGGLPTPGGLPTSNTVGDHLSLDLSAIATTSAVIVTTAPGQVIASGYAGFSFVDIEDLDLYDSTGLTTIEMGDLYARGTEQADSFVFTNGWLPSQPSLMRVMINSFGGYLTIPGKIVVYARGGNDYLTQHDTPRVAHFYGEGGNDYLAGALQDDLLVGGLNDDQLLGSSGSDTIWGDEGATPANPAPQDDVAGGFDRINGGLGNDIIYAGGGNDQAYGNGDDDYLHGGQGDDTLDGGEGNDRVYGSFGNDQLSGYFGYDLLSGGEGNDILTGNSGNDVLIGGLGGDSLVGNEDSDLMVTGTTVPVGAGATSANSTTAGDANDQALLALLLAWGTTGTDRSLLGTVTQDGVYDEVFSGNGNDDITRDNPLDRLFDFTVGTDEEF